MDNGIINIKMGEANKFVLMELCMRDIGKITSRMVAEGRFLLMDKYTKENGARAEFKGKASFLDKMGPHTLDNGSTTCRTVMAIKNGPTEPSMKEVLLIVTSKAMEYSKRRMEASMKDNLKRIKSKAMVTLCGQTEVNTKAFGRMTR